MKITITRLQVYTKLIGTLALVAILATACSKKDDPAPKQDTPPPSSTTVPYYTLERVENLPDSLSDADPTATQLPFYFSLAYKQVERASYAKTTYWDICFSGIYDSFMSGNNGSNSANAGYQGPGKGGITIVAQDFNDVTDVPSDSQFQTGAAIVGTDGKGAFATTLTTVGWYLYDYGGNVVGDGSADKQHVAYALGNALKLADGSTLPARTVIVKMGNGDYAKIRMISCYKNAFTPDQMLINTPHMFFTFEYVIVPAGSTKFTIKN